MTQMRIATAIAQGNAADHVIGICINPNEGRTALNSDNNLACADQSQGIDGLLI